jgi:O-antigen/teichoic acid export membrane protein
VSLVDHLRRFRSSELGGFAGDALHVGIWQAAISIADVVQLALITHVLGLAEFGRLALAMSFVILVGQFFDLRVGAAATRFGSARLAAEDVEGFAGVLQLSYLLDGLTGIAGFAVVAGLAPFVGPSLIGDDGTTLVILYACTLLISTVDESSVSVLRVLDRFRLLTWFGVLLEILRIGLIGAALAISASLTSVLLALIAYDLAGAAINLLLANNVFSRTFGRSFFRRSLSAFGERKRMIRMVMHTNVVSYARLAQVQLPTLLVGALGTTTQVGVYKVGTAAGTIVGRLADPGYAAVLPRLSRLWASRRLDDVRSLIRASTVVSGVVVGIALILVILLREPVLRLLGGEGGRAAATVLVLAGIGQAVNGIFFWNTGLLYASGRSGSVAAIAVVGAATQTALLVALVPSFGADGAAVALVITLIATNIVATLLCWRVLQEPPASRPSAPVTDSPVATSPSGLEA